MKPKSSNSNSDSSQDWFWTPQWQAREKEVDRDLVNGRFTVYNNMADFLSSLDEE